MRVARHNELSPARRAFTLVELLVAIVIFSILVTIAIGAFSESEYDRASAAAQQLHSMLEGSRSRAIHSQQIRGIQLIPDQNSPNYYVAAQYVGAPRIYEGTLSNIQLTGGDWQVSVAGNQWINLVRRGLMATKTGATGLRIEIPAFSGHWYTLVVPAEADLQTSTLMMAKIQGHYLSSTWNGTTYLATPATNVPYRLELIPPPLPGSSPQPLADKIAISASASNPPLTNDVILFSPRGQVVGGNASQGLMHFYLAAYDDLAEADQLAGGVATGILGDVETGGTKGIRSTDRIITLFTRTGLITSSAVNHVDLDTDGWADDPFFFAKTGKGTK
ncbi:MAG: prepilin-type N-terminal cleavage/methylation domain-containing protein [Planctomycetaceae bacterium]